MLKQRSEEWMRERADELKGKVRQMFGADRATSVAGMVNLVDELERLGVEPWTTISARRSTRR
jgi:hypothetical protein